MYCVDLQDHVNYVIAEDMSNSKLHSLHSAAVNYCSGGNTQCVWLYRNKSAEYFAEIKASGGVMRMKMKDNGGDPDSPINGRLSGLFFLAKNECGNPPQYSYFGPSRIQIKADELFRLAPNLYFADFYCMTGKRHYVIVVMTRTGSAADLFCRRHLIPLDSANNPFFFFQNGHLHTTDARNIDVEVFYTEDLNINHLEATGTAIMTTVPILGQGHSTPGGKPKYQFCTICNKNAHDLFGQFPKYLRF